MRFGILGGTFDPIHFGHLFIAEEARVRFRLDRVLFVPNGTPPHKPEGDRTPARHRFAMTGIAVADNPFFECSALELNRPGPSYTVDTLAALRAERPDAELFYITGLDAIADLMTWKRHEEVIAAASFIAARRPGTDPDVLRERLPAAYRERVLLLGSAEIGISATDIRERLRTGQAARYLLPDAVLAYAAKHRL